MCTPFATMSRSDSDYSELGFKLGQRKRVMKDLAVLRERRESAAKLAEQHAAEAAARAASRSLERRRRAAERAEARAARRLASLEAAESRPRELVPRPSCPALHRPPTCCFLFGAPVGFFAAIEPRDSRIIGPETVLVEQCALYNVFHPCVASSPHIVVCLAFFVCFSFALFSCLAPINRVCDISVPQLPLSLLSRHLHPFSHALPFATVMLTPRVTARVFFQVRSDGVPR